MAEKGIYEVEASFLRRVCYDPMADFMARLRKVVEKGKVEPYDVDELRKTLSELLVCAKRAPRIVPPPKRE